MNASLTNMPENIQKLMAAAQAPGPLRDALLTERAKLDVPGLIALAKSHGVDVSAAELETFAASQPDPTELSDEALGSVAGGLKGAVKERVGDRAAPRPPTYGDGVNNGGG